MLYIPLPLNILGVGEPFAFWTTAYLRFDNLNDIHNMLYLQKNVYGLSKQWISYEATLP